MNGFLRSTVVVSAVLLTVCCKGGVASEQPIAVKLGVPPFVLPSGARNARVIQQGEGATQYELNEAYPATASLAEIQKALEAANWTPLSEDLWNPGLPSSNKVGWGNYVDGTKSPKVRVYQWLGYWRNSAGDVLMYGLRYQAPNAEVGALPVGNGVAVTEIFSAAALLRARVKVPPQ